MLADELLPCPGAWCKHKAEPRLVSGGGGLHSVICGDCRTQGPISSDKDFAIAAWNTRPEASQGEVEKDYEVWQNGGMAASSSSETEARRYAMIYAQDGPVQLFVAETTRTLLATIDPEAILKGERKPE